MFWKQVYMSYSSWLLVWYVVYSWLPNIRSYELLMALHDHIRLKLIATYKYSKRNRKGSKRLNYFSRYFHPNCLQCYRRLRSQSLGLHLGLLRCHWSRPQFLLYLVLHSLLPHLCLHLQSLVQCPGLPHCYFNAKQITVILTNSGYWLKQFIM